MKLLTTDEPDGGDIVAIRAGLLAFNAPYLGVPDHRPLAVVARQQSTLRGGLSGETARGFLRVDMLWVAPVARRGGLGSRLLLAAETEAVARGCHSAVLDTASFQARPFYERHGYRMFGRLDGLPNGHHTCYLVKRLHRST